MAPRITDSSAARLIVSIDSVSLFCDRLIHNHDSKQYASCQQTGGGGGGKEGVGVPVR